MAGRRRRIAHANLAYCLPELTPEERDALLVRHFHSLGFSILEVALAWHAPPALLERAVSVEGDEHIDAGLAAGRGVLLLAGHFTTLEIGAARLGVRAPVDGVYRPVADPVMERALRAGRQRFGGQLLQRDDIRNLFRCLRANRAVWYAPDQDMGSRHSVFAPFFGRPAATLTTVSRIARTSGAAVLPFRVERAADGRAWRAVVEPALDGFPCGDDEADAARVNGLVERWARARPEQYLWVHRRFKTRPPGEPPVYPA